jgi:hypothetical protein
MALVPIKFSFNNDVRRLKVSKQIAYPELLSLVQSLFKIDAEWETLSLKYTDNENDKCTVTGEKELREAFSAKKDDILKLELCFPPKNVEAVQQSLPFGFDAFCRRRSQQDPLVNRTQQPTQQPTQIEARRSVLPEIVNRRTTIFGLTEEGIALMDSHKYNEAKEVFANQAEMFNCAWKKSVPYYNIACCEALLGNSDSALAYLAKAINCGYKNVQHMDQDKDLDSLRGLDAFKVMMGEIKNAPHLTEAKKECRWKGRFENMNCHLKRNNTVLTSPSAQAKEEKVEIGPNEVKEVMVETCPVFSTVTGEIVGEIKTPVFAVDTKSISSVAETVAVIEQKTEVASTPVAVTEPVEFGAELYSLFQMGFTDELKNKKMLRKTNGNLSEAVVLLLR